MIEFVNLYVCDDCDIVAIMPADCMQCGHEMKLDIFIRSGERPGAQEIVPAAEYAEFMEWCKNNREEKS